MWILGEEQAEVRDGDIETKVWHVMKCFIGCHHGDASQQPGVQAVQAIRLSKIVRGDKRAVNQARDHQCSEGGKQRETMKRYGEREAGEV